MKSGGQIDMWVDNKSEEKYEPGELKKCPRCKGFGSNSGDEGACYICKGQGTVWLSKTGSGWTRAKWVRIDDSQLY